GPAARTAGRLPGAGRARSRAASRKRGALVAGAADLHQRRLRQRLAPLGREVLADLGFELAAELGEEAEHRPGGGFAERADGVAGDAVRDRRAQVDVAGAAFALGQPRGDARQPAGAFAARRALAARLVRVEAHDARGDGDEVGGLVHDDDAARAGHGAQDLAAAHVEVDAGADLNRLDALVGHERVELHRDVELAGVERRHRRAAGDDGLDLLAAGDAAADLVDHLAQRDAHRQLVDAGLVEVARHAEDARAARLGRAELGEPLPALLDDVRDVGDGLDVVDDGRLAPDALDRGERRLQARPAALALERVEERRLLAADVRAGAAVDGEVELPAGPARVVEGLTEVAGGVGFVDGALEHLVLADHLAANVDVRVLAAERVRRDEDAFDERVRIPVEELAVLAGAGLGLVGVDDEVGGLGVLRDEAPLEARREAGAAAAAEVRLLDLVDDGGGRHAEGFLVGPVDAAAGGFVEAVGAFDADEAHHQLRHVLERDGHG